MFDLHRTVRDVAVAASAGLFMKLMFELGGYVYYAMKWELL
jgi:hypothetical protein